MAPSWTQIRSWVRVLTGSPVGQNVGTRASGSRRSEATHGGSYSRRGTGEPLSPRIVGPRPIVEESLKIQLAGRRGGRPGPRPSAGSS
jgi:hypothetical protein